jgi:hypothetical protein
VQAVSRSACWARHDGLLSSALGKQGSRAEEGERRERELTLVFLKKFNGSSKIFEYKSCSKFYNFFFHA